MWRKIRAYSAFFKSAVLTGVDAAGYPCSVRCVPVFDDETQSIRVSLAQGATHTPGRVSMLFHKHNEQLWGFKIFQLLGNLEHTADGWVVQPDRLIPGSGMSMLGDITYISNARRTANQYLAKRGLSRPPIPWDRIESFYS